MAIYKSYWYRCVLWCRLMAEVEEVHEEQRRAGLGPAASTDNPLQAFHLIRRFSTASTWRTLTALVADNSSRMRTYVHDRLASSAVNVAHCCFPR